MWNVFFDGSTPACSSKPNPVPFPIVKWCRLASSYWVLSLPSTFSARSAVMADWSDPKRFFLFLSLETGICWNMPLGFALFWNCAPPGTTLFDLLSPEPLPPIRRRNFCWRLSLWNSEAFPHCPRSPDSSSSSVTSMLSSCSSSCFFFFSYFPLWVFFVLAVKKAYH